MANENRFAKLYVSMLSDDELLDFAKKHAEAFRVYVLSILWCADWKSNGVVSRRALRYLECASRTRSLLVEAGYFDESDDGGVVVHNYLKYQTSREDIEANTPLTNAERQRRWRENQQNKADSDDSNKQSVTKTVTPTVTENNADRNEDRNATVTPTVTESVTKTVTPNVTENNATVTDRNAKYRSKNIEDKYNDSSNEESYTRAREADASLLHEDATTPPVNGIDYADMPDPFTMESRIGRQFTEFWSLYPRKEDKRLAMFAFKRALKRTKWPMILSGATKYAHDPNLPPMRFVKKPANWLDANSWSNPALPPLDTRDSGQNPAQLRFSQNLQAVAEVSRNEQQATMQPMMQIGDGQ